MNTSSTRIEALPFLLPYALPLAMTAGYVTEDLSWFRAVPWMWLIVAALDAVVRPRRAAGGAQPRAAQEAVPWRLIVLSWVPVQAVMLGCGLLITTWETVTARDLLLVVVSTGVASGICCIPAAHELMHSKSRAERIAAEWLMLGVSYPHFCIEHVEGHHRHVGTVDDAATARLGESFYTFYRRVVFDGMASAWALERARLERLGVRTWSSRNRLLWRVACLAAIYATILASFGWRGIAFFFVQSVIAFSLLEAINYVEHYGLTRRATAPGRHERVMPWHSWDSSHRVSNWLLLNLGRHGDHHCRPHESYGRLRPSEPAPQLPAGYFAMLPLTLVPRLWRAVMDARVHHWRRMHETRGGSDEDVRILQEGRPAR